MSILEQLQGHETAPYVRRLSQRSANYLQTLVTSFKLIRTGEGLQLQLRIDDDPLTIVDGLGKRDVERLAREPGVQACDQLRSRIEEIVGNPDHLGYKLDCSDWPMRYANGGVLPIVHLEGKDYFLLFYRDIFPIGWNIANGASDDEEEWIDPGRIIHREFAEEVLCTDPTEKLLYLYEPPGGRHRFGFHRDALSAWLPHRPELAEYTQVPMSFKWIDGPDSIRIEYGRETYEHDGFFLSATADDHGIEVDRLVLIRLPGDSRLLSGEIADGRPFNQIVGLFDVERLQSIYAGHEFLPDLCFFNGERYTDDEFHEVLPKYLEHVRAEPGPGLPRLRRPDQCEYYESAEVRFNFCPISRAIIGRYYEWRDSGVSVPAEAVSTGDAADRPGSAAPTSASSGHDLFISHASRHVDFARTVHQRIATELPRHPAFLSTQSLVEQGESNYRRAIERALLDARCLIVVLLEPEDLESGWIDYEWTAFSSEIIAGRKPGNIFTLIDRDRLTIEDLPLGLRQYEVIPLDRSVAEVGLQRLCGFLAQALKSEL